MNELALFAGAGGGILGGKLLGWRTVCAVERDAYAAQVLAQRQNDGILQAFPIWSDVSSFDGRPWRGIVDVVSGGFPCQDISVAGKGAGLNGDRSGLWKEFLRIIGEVRPRFVFVENSPMLTSRGLGKVLGDLAALGYDAEWGVLSCEDVGGVHLRERIWIKATHAMRHGYIRQEAAEENPYRKERVAEACQYQGRTVPDEIKPGITNPDDDSQRSQGRRTKPVYRFTRFPWGEDVRRIEDLQGRPDIPQPLIRRIGDDVAFGVDRLKAIGNGQVPRLAATAWDILSA